MKIRTVIILFLVLSLIILSGCVTGNVTKCKKTYNTLKKQSCLTPPTEDYNECYCKEACRYHCSTIGWDFEYVQDHYSCGFLGLGDCCDCVCSRCS